MSPNAGPAASPRALVEGALLAAVSVALVLLSAFVPVVGSFMVLAVPIPVVLTYLRHGGRTALLALVVAGVALAAILGPLDALARMVTLGSLGLAFGWTIRRRAPAVQILAAGAGASLMSLLLGLAATKLFLHESLLAEMVDAYRQAAGSVPAFYARLGMPAQAQEQIRSILQAFVQILPRLLPAALVVAAVVLAAGSFAITRRVLLRLGYEVPALPPFSAWSMPRLAAVAWVIPPALEYLARRTGNSLYAVAGLDVGYLLGLAYTLTGLSFAYYLLGRVGVPKAFAVAALAASAIQPLLSQILLVAGVWESVFRYRELGKARQEVRP